MREQIKQIIALLPDRKITVQADIWDDWSQSWAPADVELSLGPRGGLVARERGEDVLAGLPQHLYRQQLQHLLAGLAKASE